MHRRFAVALVACLALPGIHTIWANASKPDVAQAVHLSTYRWQLQESWFGGFSGLEVSDNGRDMLIISDRGHFVQGTIVRDGDAIVGVSEVRHAKVLRKGGHFAKRAGLRDSEGLAQRSNGDLLVSFEGEHRLERFAKAGTRPKVMPWHPDFDRMELNSGFEALAVDKSGTVYAMAEKPLGDASMVQVFALKGNTWRKAFSLKRDKQFQPVGADFGPDGRLYVLERGFNGFGFRTRARSFAVGDTGATNEKLLFRKGVGVHDNLEGLAVWRDKAGRIRLTMISDDNFRLVQRTEIVEYVIPQ